MNTTQNQVNQLNQIDKFCFTKLLNFMSKIEHCFADIISPVLTQIL